MKVLAFDPGLSFGWCLLDSDRAACGTLNLDRYRDDFAACFHHSLEFVRDKIECARPDIVAIERQFTSAGSYGPLTTGIEAIIHLAAWGQAVPRRVYGMSTVKKALGIGGNAAKAEILPAVTALGFAPRNRHEADAIALALCARSLEQGTQG